MSIITFGLDPQQSKINTFGFGSEVIVEITILPHPGGRGTAGRKKREEDRLIRVRVLDDDGKTMIQEQLFSEDELKKLEISINEYQISGRDIYINIKQNSIKEGQPTKIIIKTHETSER